MHNSASDVKSEGGKWGGISGQGWALLSCMLSYLHLSVIDNNTNLWHQLLPLYSFSLGRDTFLLQNQSYYLFKSAEGEHLLF